MSTIFFGFIDNYFVMTFADKEKRKRRVYLLFGVKQAP